MPLPERKDHEDRDKFIARCLASKVMKNEFPDEKKRQAVCYDLADRKHE